jgi:peptidoglycan hydrolase-like protein with peptidoglycan-binding domain
MEFPAFQANVHMIAASRNAPAIRSGAHGSHVRLLQGALMDLGFKMPKSVRSTGRPDGVFGPETFGVVTRFQAKNGLKSDGVAGAKTLAKLDQLMVAKTKPSTPTLSFNMFPEPSSPEYKLGGDDPPLRHDPGAGRWNSVPKSMVTSAQAGGIVSVLPAAYAVIGDDAAKHLWHYFGNTGTPLTIDLEGMVKEVPSAMKRYRAEVRQAKGFVERLQSGTFQITSRVVNGGYNLPSESKNWYFAVGGYVTWGKGRVDVAAGPVETITLEFEYCFYDRYNWDRGKSVEIMGVEITDRFMGEFHRQGEAREYDEVGSFKRRFQWRRGEPMPEAQF